MEITRLDFIETAIAYCQKERNLDIPKVLDLGCATGTTAIQLMRRGMDVVGIDNNAQMIQSAARRNPEPKTHARFFLMDVSDAHKYLPKNSFDIVICLGNTLPHLNSLESIENLITSVHGLLKTGGVFIFQLINYDMILSEHLESLPTIETTRSSFVRRYTINSEENITFEASVLASKGQTVFTESVSLYPLKSKDLLKALSASGFTNEMLYSDFDKSPLEESSLAIVGIAVKE
ncbi:MAG: class I SAM-dependent methyltransferase [Treponema sp.]|nr:class I SAM-dependent methyltransferase [Treponema sp.]